MGLKELSVEKINFYEKAMTFLRLESSLNLINII
jgi:hypothetical protein